MSIFESFLYNITLLIISFHLCVSLKNGIQTTQYIIVCSKCCVQSACMFLYSHTVVVKDFDNNIIGDELLLNSGAKFQR